MDEISEKVFCDLMELPPGEREAALDACAELSAPQKDAIRRMLEDAMAADAYFAGAPDAVRQLHGNSMIEGQGDLCGPYKLIRKLGEGGFGVVWLAEQEKPLRRSVALKVIKAGMDSHEVLTRFDAEKQALARMDHPNIAKVLDAGLTETGRPYFAMELVMGRPITRFCEEQELGTSERLRLFMDVCAALNHAHQKGVIHRDIKPSNVMVTLVESRPQVKVIDFGIAKAVEGNLSDHTLHTRTEQWIGTPAYMSPEQAGLASADLDTRSDIYALGVILYELITGGPPFDSKTLMKAGYEEMRRIIREQDPPRPSVRITTQRQLREAGPSDLENTPSSTIRAIKSELDWIVMKAIEKSRDRRYETASSLADDIGRFLRDEPVSARPPSAGYLLTKFARRHRLGIHIASAFLVLIVGAVLLSVWLAVRARDAERIAQERLTEALKDRRAKIQALEEAESISSLFADVFQRPQPGVDGRSVTVLQALDVAVEKLDVQLATQPQRRAKLRAALADTYESLSIFDRSVKLREQNYETYKEVSGPGHLLTQRALHKLVEAAEASGDSKTALKYAVLQREVLREISATNYEIETSMRSVVRSWFGVGERKQAIESQRDLVDYCSRVFGLDSQQDVKAKWELRQYNASLHGVSTPPGTRGDNTPAEPKEESKGVDGMLAMEENFAALTEVNGPMHTDTILARMKLAGGLFSAGHTIEALMHLQALQSITMKSFGHLDERTLVVQRNLVRAYIKLGRLVDAVRPQQAVVSALRERDGGSAQTTVDAEDSLERRFFYSSLREEGDAFKKDLLQRRIKLFGKDHVNTVMLRNGLDPNHADESIENMKNTIRLMREEDGNKGRTTAEAIAALARAYVSLGRTKEAIRLYAECGPNMLDDTWLNFECATFQLWTRDLDGFRKTRRNIVGYWERRISIQRSTPEMFDRMLWLSCIAELDDEQQKGALRKVLDHVESIRAGLHVEAEERFPKSLQKQIKGTVLYRFGMYEEALATFQEANRLMNSGRTDPTTLGYQDPPLWVYFFMAMSQHRLGNTLEAKRLFNLGQSRLPENAPSRENPVVKYFTGGEALTRWIIHSEAKDLIFGE